MQGIQNGVTMQQDLIALSLLHTTLINNILSSEQYCEASASKSSTAKCKIAQAALQQTYSDIDSVRMNSEKSVQRYTERINYLAETQSNVEIQSFLLLSFAVILNVVAVYISIRASTTQRFEA